MPPFLTIAAAVVRGWTRLYTWRLPVSVRTARLKEIDSDLWEFEADAARGEWRYPSLQALLRLAVGIPDDLRWRLESAPSGRAAAPRIILAGAAAVLLTLLWVAAQFQEPRIPRTPTAARLQFRLESIPAPTPPPPPPPPPPPCARRDAKGACR